MPADLADDADIPVVALVGRPNVGKSTFLARASRRFVETANAPGTTIDLERRRITAGDREAWLVDLPGTRALDDEVTQEAPFWELLIAARPDSVLVVGDAGNLERHLPLALACRDLGLPIVFAANLVDEARRHGIEVDIGRLSQLLGAPVHLTCGRTGDGVDETLADAVRLAGRRAAVRRGEASPRGTVPASPYAWSIEQRLAELAASLRAAPRSLGAAAQLAPLQAAVLDGAIAGRGAASLRLTSELEPSRWATAASWAREVEHRRSVPEPLADRIGRWTTSPWPGIPAFIAVGLGAFLLVMVIGGWLAALLGVAWAATVSPVLAWLIPTVVPLPVLPGALLWAVDGGLLAMLSVGLPYVLTFYLLLAVLEDSGYLTSTAVLMDRVFGVMGLPGRAAIPLLAAAGCNVPAIYGTRVLRSRRERVLASWLITLTPCSARSAVVIAALAPFAGVPVALGAFGVVALATIASGLAANALIPGRQPSLILELAPLRRPILGHVLAKAWWRFRGFVVTATPVMLVGSFVLGLVYESGLWAGVASTLGPAIEWWLGLPAIAGVAIAFAFLRKELALQLLIAFAAVEIGRSASLGELMGPQQLFVYAVVSSLSVPCIATVAALRGELGTRTTIGISVASIALALGVGGVLARLLAIA